MLFRELHIEDVQTITHVIHDSYKNFDNKIPSSYTRANSKAVQSDLSSNYKYFGIIVDNEITGITSIISYNSEILHISKFHVKTANQGSQIAHKMLSLLESYAGGKGYKIITLNAFSWAQWSVKFYEKNNFKRYEFGDEKINENFENNINQRRRLNKLNDNDKRLFWKSTK